MSISGMVTYSQTNCQSVCSKSLDLLNGDGNCSHFRTTGLDSGAHILPQTITSECCTSSSLLDGVQVKIIANVARKHLLCKF